jgi:hypothetical protein
MEQANLFNETSPSYLKHNFSFLELRLIDLLISHKGCEGAISRDKLAAMLGVSDRKLRDMLAILTTEKECLIGSTLKPRPGYYWINKPSELAQEVAPLRSRVKEINKRVNALVNTFEKDNGTIIISDLKRTV